MSTLLDPGQAIKQAFDDTSQAFKVELVAGVTVGAVEIKDGVSGTLATVKPASTAASTTDEALVVAISPNNTVGVTQSGSFNITNVSGTISLPTGAATAAKQPSLGTAGSASADVITVQGITSMTPIKVDGSAITQPVSIASAIAATQSGTWSVRNQDGSGNTLSSTGNALDVNLKTNGISSFAVTQSGTWNNRTQDGSGTAITSSTQGSKIGLNSSEIGYSAINFARNDYSSASVSTSAYTQLIASTSGNCQEIEIFDSSGQTLKLATGGAGLETDQILIFPGGNGRVKLSISSGTRISIKAVSATANVGEIDINLYG